ncbi:methyl-accepting chemotaxis protein [Massilia litorea]|uniref:Tar ligand binding domain-containing protein n=1 Tax=Massilia litorea TaxID=2769491 RepID=A0A7L9U0F4_9BURK|nr:methyl-accepting chemotaxis protein [Massilia litorea]QOL48511.1 Tar ligand binding domain-containing protein [Massilia litorea]
MFKNLSIKLRLVLLTAILSAVAMVVGAVGLANQSAANAALGTVYNDRVVVLAQLGNILSLMQQNQNALARAVLAGEADADATVAEVEGRIRQISAIWSDYKATYLTDEEKVLAQVFIDSRTVFVEQGLKPTLAALRGHEVDGAKELVKGSLNPLFLPAQKNMQALIQLQLDVAKHEYDLALERYARARTLSIVLTAAGVLVGSAIAWLLIRGLSRSIGEALRLARSVAAGDLTQSVRVESNDEIGQLLGALQKMNASLSSIVTQVRAGTDTIATASQQIAAGNQDLSARTEQQASSLEETAASMEELASTVKNNADNARQANTLAVAASSVAERGGQVIGKVVGTMVEINDASRKIADITSVIDGIAFQTNILALNAAVEAARAGEHGRGFAVVASEVRNLAQRSAAAAKEIKALIEDSVQRAHAGGELVEQAGTTMRDIVTSVQRVTDIMGEISSASTEQTAGIEQINAAVMQMDQVTQQNAALVEEAAAAAEAMQDQAVGLAQAVSVFRTGQVLAGAPAVARRLALTPAEG